MRRSVGGGQRTGFTLIEITISIVIVGMLGAALVMFYEVQQKRHFNDRRIRAAHIARAVLEYETAKRFEDIVSVASINAQDYTGAGLGYNITSIDHITVETIVTCLAENFGNNNISSWVAGGCAPPGVAPSADETADRYKLIQVNADSTGVETVTIFGLRANIDGFGNPS